MTDLLHATQKFSSYSDTPQFSRIPKKTSMTDFSDNPELNIRNIFGELTPAKFLKLILNKLGNGINDIVQNEIKEHLKNESANLINQLIVNM